MWIWILAVLIGGFGFTIGVELLLTRLGIRPVDPAARSGGLRDVAQKVNNWSASRRAGHDGRRAGDRDRS
ncbi:hypothetical protein BH20CHL1_BH20CHL1_04900 [soil metagenome]|jgi:hypothetical protein|nr:hypothetical protein [Chloroflexia bacterium]